MNIDIELDDALSTKENNSSIDHIEFDGTKLSNSDHIDSTTDDENLSQNDSLPAEALENTKVEETLDLTDEIDVDLNNDDIDFTPEPIASISEPEITAEFSDDDISPILDETIEKPDVELSKAISMQFEDDQSAQEQKSSTRDSTNLEDFDTSSNSIPPKKELASGFINHTITRIQMSSDSREAIKLASEGLIKAGSVFGLFIKEDNSIEPISMWQGNQGIAKPTDEDLENFVYEIGATKDNISADWTQFTSNPQNIKNCTPWSAQQPLEQLLCMSLHILRRRI